MKSFFVILTIGLCGFSAQAADLVRCKVSSRYNVRNDAGVDTGKKFSGSYVCSAQSEKRTYIDKKETKSAQFYQVTTPQGSFWIAKKGIKILGPVTAQVSEDSKTEAALPVELACDGSCDKNDGSASVGDLQATIREIQTLKAVRRIKGTTNDPDSMNPLYEEYQKVQSTFIATHPLGKRSKVSWARLWKVEFLNYLVEKMGPEKANKVIMALTAYGEARDVSKDEKWQNTAEMAMVVTVLKNRGATSYRDNTDILESRDPLLVEGRVALSDEQFSVWKKDDPNLFAMLHDRANVHLIRAFQAVDLVERNKIVPMGELANKDTRHFYTGKKPKWAKEEGGGHKIVAQLDTPAGVVTIGGHYVFRGVR